MKIQSQFFFWVFAIVATLILINVFQDVLLPFVLGSAIAYLLNPMVVFLTKKGVGRPMAAMSIVGLFFATLALLLVIISPVLFREAEGFAQSLPTYIEKLRAMAEMRMAWIQDRLGDDATNQIQSAIQDNMGEALGFSKTLLTGITSGGKAFVHFVTTLFITPIAAYFFIKEWPRVTAWTAGLIPRQHIGVVSNLLGQIDRKISGFVRGQISVCFALGGVYAVALSIAGLDYGFFIGLGTGILSVIPFVGSSLGLVTSLAVAYFGSGGDWAFIGTIAAIFAVGQFIEGHFIAPKLIGDSVGLHPLWIIFALMAGGSFMGIVGMFLAVPVAASVGVLIGFALDEYKKSRYFSTHNDLQPTTTPNSV